MDAFAGIRLIARNPRLWPLCWGPVLGALAVYVGVGLAMGLWVVPHLLEAGWVRDRLGVTAGTQGWEVAKLLGSVLFLVLWVFLFSYVFLVLAGLFSSFLWDRLSREVELLAG